MRTKKLRGFFEENGFKVYLVNEATIKCAEIEKWTDRGVDMNIWLNPFTVNEFKRFVEDFNTDEEIDLHRQDERYKKEFTISQSLKDFTDFHTHLKEVLLKLPTT